MSHAPADRAELADALKHRASVADTCKRYVHACDVVVGLCLHKYPVSVAGVIAVCLDVVD